MKPTREISKRSSLAAATLCVLAIHAGTAFARDGNSAALPPADCHAALKQLNDNGKLVPDGFMPNVKLGKIELEDCSGFAVANKGRLMLHSPKGGYGYSGSQSSQLPDGTFKTESFTWTATVYSEFPFSVGEHRLAPGGYAIEVYADSIRFSGNDPASSYFNPRLQKQVPQRLTKKLTVNRTIPEEIVSGKQLAPLALASHQSSATLDFLGNSWKITPR